jgi:hypothetical protein
MMLAGMRAPDDVRELARLVEEPTRSLLDLGTVLGGTGVSCPIGLGASAR